MSKDKILAIFIAILILLGSCGTASSAEEITAKDEVKWLNTEKFNLTVVKEAKVQRKAVNVKTTYRGESKGTDPRGKKVVCHHYTLPLPSGTTPQQGSVYVTKVARALAAKYHGKDGKKFTFVGRKPKKPADTLTLTIVLLQE